MQSIHQIEHRYLIASLVVLLLAVSTLMGRRTIITPFRYLAIVVSALMLGRYIGIAETMMQIRFLHF